MASRDIELVSPDRQPTSSLGQIDICPDTFSIGAFTQTIEVEHPTISGLDRADCHQVDRAVQRIEQGVEWNRSHSKPVVGEKREQNRSEVLLSAQDDRAVSK